MTIAEMLEAVNHHPRNDGDDDGSDQDLRTRQHGAPCRRDGDCLHCDLHDLHTNSGSSDTFSRTVHLVKSRVSILRRESPAYQLMLACLVAHFIRLTVIGPKATLNTVIRRTATEPAQTGSRSAQRRAEPALRINQRCSAANIRCSPHLSLCRGDSLRRVLRNPWRRAHRLATS